MISLGSDYSGSAIYLGTMDGRKVLTTTTIDMTHPKSGFDLLRDILKVSLSSKIWVEEPWVDGMRFPKSGLMLTRIATFIEAAAYDAGLEIEFVNPSTWRRVVYGKTRPANPKEVARKYVKEEFGFETKFKYEHNICEAILIAHYGQLQEAGRE